MSSSPKMETSPKRRRVDLAGEEPHVAAAVEKKDDQMDVEAVDKDGLSSLETLPTELFYKVVEYASERALELRESSKSLRHLVDDFAAKQTSFPLVEKLTFSSFRIPLQNPTDANTKKPDEVDVTFDVNKRAKGLFFLRLHLKGYTDFKDQVRDLEQKEEKKKEEAALAAAAAAAAEAAAAAAAAPAAPADDAAAADANAAGDGDNAATAEPAEEPAKEKPFKIENWDRFGSIKFFVETEENMTEKMKQLTKWMGRRLGRVDFHGVSEKCVLDWATTLIKDTQFNLMKVVADDFPKHVADHLLKMVLDHNVEHLALSGRFDTDIDTVTLLKQLSTQLRSLQIYQTPKKAADPAVTSKKHLFGANDEDFAALFIEMLSAKLDKLAVTNHTYDSYLTSTMTDKLITELPNLPKPVWFVASCDQYPQGLTSDSHKNYRVEVNVPKAAASAGQEAKMKQFLQIQHTTRVSEKPLDTNLVTIEDTRTDVKA